jgi:hypothetical protein
MSNVEQGISNDEVDGFVRSRHPGENRGPDIFQALKESGFRLSPE